MKKYKWMKILAVGLITLVTVVGTAESEAQQKFKFGDLFKKTKKTASKSTEDSEKKEEAEKKTEEADTPASNETTKSTDSSASKSKGASNADRLKELTDKLDLSGTDPDALVRSARERMRALQGKETSSKKESSTAAKKAEPKEKPKEVAKAKPVPVAQPTKTVKTAVTAGAVKSMPKEPSVSRPPSLAPVSALAAVSAVKQKEAPPANLQASLVASNVPLPKALVPEKLKKKKKSEEGGLEIISDEAETDLAANTVTFIGNVDLKEPTFNLKCDRLVVFMNDKGDNSGGQFKEAVATGAMVIVERINGDGEKDVGHSRKVVYDARTGDIILSGGPPVLNSGGGTVKTTHPDATIVLKKDGNHRVKQRGVFIIPVKGKMGETRKGPNLMPSKLGDISNRK